MLPIPESYSGFLHRLYSHTFTNESPKEILDFSIQITEDCNLRCAYCYQPNKYPTYMTFDTAKKVIDYVFDVAVYDDTSLFSYKRNFGIVFDFIGGEPLLAIDTITQMIDYIEYRMLHDDSPWLYTHKYNFSSNGTLYFTDKVQNLINKYGQKISMSITVDGCKELHDKCRLFPNGSGSYDLAIAAALDQLHRFNNAATKITLSPENIEFMVPATKNMFSLGFYSLMMNYVHEDVWTNDDATRFYYYLKDLGDFILDNDYEEKCYIMLFDDTFFGGYPMDPFLIKSSCGGTGNMVAVDANGDFYPCFRYMRNALNDKQPPLKIGNYKIGMYSTPDTKKILDDFKSITIGSQSPKKCLTCPIANGCGCCPGFNYQCFGTANHRTTFICQMHKARALGNLYFWKKYEKKSNKANHFVNCITDEIALEIIPLDEWNMLKNL